MNRDTSYSKSESCDCIEVISMIKILHSKFEYSKLEFIVRT